MLKSLLLGFLLACSDSPDASGTMIMGFTDTTPKSEKMQIYLLDRDSFFELSATPLVEPHHALSIVAKKLSLPRANLLVRRTTHKKDLETGKIVRYHRVGILGAQYDKDVLVLPQGRVLEPTTVPSDYMSRRRQAEGCANKTLQPTA